MTLLLKLGVTLLLLLISTNIITNTEKTAKLYRILRQYHRYKVESYYQKRQNWATSNLGSFMFKNNKISYYSKNKTFLILYWKYWNGLKYRHPGDFFANCSVSNCKVTASAWDMSLADAVMIHVQPGLLPMTMKRPTFQRWIFMSDESPVYVFAGAAARPNMAQWANIFNWTMTYRTDSDIPVPYGRTVPLSTPLFPKNMSESIKNLIPNWKLKQKDVYITALISHCCVPERMKYIQELEKHITVDIYGRCRNHKDVCPGHAGADCPAINKYLFYLAFENSMCRQYITEKTFHNAYAKGSIPIIMGAPKADCEKMLPPHSFLHVENFQRPRDLAKEVKRLVRDEHKLLMYHQWRRFFEVKNEHGFFKTNSNHICRVCEALNYNDVRPKIYNERDLRLFVEPKLLCKSVLPSKCRL